MSYFQINISHERLPSVASLNGFEIELTTAQEDQAENTEQDASVGPPILLSFISFDIHNETAGFCKHPCLSGQLNSYAEPFLTRILFHKNCFISTLNEAISDKSK